MIHSDDNVEKNSVIKECEPLFVYNELINNDLCYLIDVRSQPEWNFVGFPDSKDMKNDIIFCEWAFYPMMDKNPNFENEIFSKLNINNCKDLYFICRSGSRSFHAAKSVQVLLNQKTDLRGDINCINVKFGFEGDLSKNKRRGNSNGWKFSNLPWMQL